MLSPRSPAFPASFSFTKSREIFIRHYLGGETMTPGPLILMDLPMERYIPRSYPLEDALSNPDYTG